MMHDEGSATDSMMRDGDMMEASGTVKVNAY
jgi:hypothetical protein